MPRPISKVAPEWWDYTTLDPALLADAAKLTADDLLQLSRPGFKVTLYDTLGERDRRLYAAAEALNLPHGGVAYLARLFACDPKTIRRGWREVQQLSTLPPGGERIIGAAGHAA